MQESQIKTIGISIGFGLIGVIVYYVYRAYRQSIKPSKFMIAAQKMRFIGYEKTNEQKITMAQQQEALLQIFHLAGYFKLSNIWHDLNCIKSLRNPEQIFQEISAVVKFSNADQPNPRKFNAKYLRKNLFKSDNTDIQDVLDIILYIGQHAFTRQKGQERYEVVSPNWIIRYADEYCEAARLLRLIDREDASLEEYDGVWIAGASRTALSERIIDFNYQLTTRNIKINGETLVLAGERELWANIDGISPILSRNLLKVSQNNINVDNVSFSLCRDDRDAIIKEGKSYMVHLAQSYNIKLNASEPFIEYKNKEECPSGRFPNRIYANYDSNETSALTETLMAHDLLHTLSSHVVCDISIVDTAAQNDSRPNTASTARDAAERFVNRILAGYYGTKKRFVILLCSNNPFIERQTLATQRQVNEVLEKYDLIDKDYQIKIEGVGYSCRESLAVVHSELGALLAEKWKLAVADIKKSSRLKSQHDIKSLLFQTRNTNIIIGNQPIVEKNYFPGNFIQNWFDSFLS